MAHAVPVLQGHELHVLQEGEAIRGGNIALIAAGTGLGEALLHNVRGRFIPSPSEAGHADFPARTEREIQLVRDLTARYGRAEIEHVVSGRGLINIHRSTHTQPCAAAIDLDDADAPAKISAAALERACAQCVETLDLFVGAYGAEAGNLALRTVATGGVFIGGGIAPKILPALTAGTFMHAFRSKAAARCAPRGDAGERDPQCGVRSTGRCRICRRPIDDVTNWDESLDGLSVLSAYVHRQQRHRTNSSDVRSAHQKLPARLGSTGVG